MPRDLRAQSGGDGRARPAKQGGFEVSRGLSLRGGRRLLSRRQPKPGQRREHDHQRAQNGGSERDLGRPFIGDRCQWNQTLARSSRPQASTPERHQIQRTRPRVTAAFRANSVPRVDVLLLCSKVAQRPGCVRAYGLMAAGQPSSVANDEAL